MLIDRFKEKMHQSVCMGIFSKTVDSNMVEAAGLAGLDFIILDMEHGPATLETMHNHVRAAVVADFLPIIRVKGPDAHAIGSALDTGALGVQVPNISNAQQAQEAVNAAKFHPHGMRGVCRFVRAGSFGHETNYYEKANESLVILQVEGVEGINNLDAILDIAGFDVLFIGPYDLSQSIGMTGQVDSPEVLKLMNDISKKAKAKGKLLGAFSDDLARNESLAKEGFNYIAYSVDINIFSSAIKHIIKRT